MKSLKILIAVSAVAGALGAVVPAQAQMNGPVAHHTVVTTRHTVVTHRTWHGRGNAQRRGHRTCTVHWAHHQRIRNCHWSR